MPKLKDFMLQIYKMGLGMVRLEGVYYVYVVAKKSFNTACSLLLLQQK